MAIGTPYLIASGSGQGANPVETITTPKPAGDAVFVLASTSAQVTAVNDTQGNTYVAIYNDTANGVSFWVATYKGSPGTPTTALSTSDTVTVTTAGTGNGAIQVDACSGLAPVPATATPARVTGTSNTASESITPGNAGDLIIGGYCFSGNAVSAAWVNGFTKIADTSITANGCSSGWLVSSPGAATFQANLGASITWFGGAASFQGLSVPVRPAQPGRTWLHRFKHRQQPPWTRGAPLITIAPTVRSSSVYASAATEASFSMPLPAFGIGDVCYIFAEDRAATGSLGAAPAGWVTVAPTFNSGSSTSSEMAVYRKVMTGGEANPVVTGTSGRFSAVAVAVQAVDNFSPEDIGAVSDNGGVTALTTITSPSVVPFTATDLLLIGFGCGTPGSAQVISYSAPAGMAIVAQISTTVAAVTESGMMVASATLASSAATAAEVTTASGSAINGQSVTIAVRGVPDAGKRGRVALTTGPDLGNRAIFGG